MSLQPTNFVVVAAPLPQDFEGTPQELFEALIKRMAIQSSSGTSFFVTGDVEPSTNQGPWLKEGKKWYVFSETEGGYVPLDISDSTARLFVVSSEEPEAPGPNDATIWLRTTAGRVIGWYFYSGTGWRPGGNVPPSGPTDARPEAPKDLEQFFDTDINALLHWERGSWRTVSGVPGDIKFVTTPTLEAALSNNPGWHYLGEDNQSYIGRVLGIASKDPGATPAASFPTDSGITARAVGDMAGAETHVLTSTEIEQHTHLVGALTGLNQANGGNTYFYRVDNGDNFLAPAPRPPNHSHINADGTSNGTRNGELPTPVAGTMLVTSKQLSLTDAAAYTEAAIAHNNIQPTLYAWALTKD
jgi:hypothetical protein